MILILDNRDSFVWNLARYFDLLGVQTIVCPSHATDVPHLRGLAPEALVISPGPCTPDEAGCSLDTVRAFRGSVPVLGVCLGHQVIAAAMGGRIIRAPQPIHGQTSPVHHDGINLFAGIPNPMIAARYHSLVVDPESLPAGLGVTARDESGTIMAIEHAADRLFGVQFHPESSLTQHGFRLVGNFLDAACVSRNHDLPEVETPVVADDRPRESNGLIATF